MTGLARQIVTCYEINGMSPIEIAQEFELEEGAVISTLIQFSTQYRADTKTEKGKLDTDFNEEQLAEVNQVLYNLATCSEDPNLQFRAARYIRHDKKGRFDKKEFKGLNINVVVFNEALQKARAAIQRGKQQVIDLPVAELSVK